MLAANPKLGPSYRLIPDGASQVAAAVGPGLVFVISPTGQVTEVRARFAAALGHHPWFDEPAGQPGRDHTYWQTVRLVPAATPLPRRGAMKSGWRRWAELVGYSPALRDYRNLGTWQGFTVWGRRGPAIRVLTDGSQQVVGFQLPVRLAFGWHPWFDQAAGRPINGGTFAIYTQTVMLPPPH